MAAVQNTAESGTDSRLTLRSRLGVITLVLLCAVQFLDIVDAAIVNVALPSIQHSLGFSQQNLQWVASGYILTYGGFLLLGGRLGDLLGRRRMLLIGLTVFALTSLAAGLANSGWLLIGSRLVQGIGAALMAPAALSKLTTSFREGKDRNTALGAWGAISGIAAAAGVFLGGAISQGLGWRWVFFVNPPICLLVVVGALALLARDHGARHSAGGFDLQGAVLVTGGTLLLVYSLVRAPVVGWASIQTILTLAGSAVLLAAFAFNELRSSHPLVPLSILRLKGLIAADLTQLIAFAGFFSLIFYATLYMQEVLHYSPLKAGAAYLPITAGFVVAGGITSQLITRIGTRPVVVAGSSSPAPASTLSRDYRWTARTPPTCSPASWSCHLVPDRCSSRSPRPLTPEFHPTKPASPPACSTHPSRSGARWDWPSCPRSQSPGPTPSSPTAPHTLLPLTPGTTAPFSSAAS